MKSKELSHIDYWLYSKLNSKIKNATAYMDGINLKDAYAEIYYNSINELKRYVDRGGDNEIVVREFLEKMVLMLAPIMPHISEEFWSMLGKSTLVAKESWPEPDPKHDKRGRGACGGDTGQDHRRHKAEHGAYRKDRREQGQEAKRDKDNNRKPMEAEGVQHARCEQEYESRDGEQPISRMSARRNYRSSFRSSQSSINMLVAKKELADGLLLKAFVEAEDYISEKFGKAEDHSGEREGLQIRKGFARASGQAEHRHTLGLRWPSKRAEWLEGIDLFIFDWDGTLNSMRLTMRINEAVKRALGIWNRDSEIKDLGKMDHNLKKQLRGEERKHRYSHLLFRRIPQLQQAEAPQRHDSAAEKG